MDEKYSAQTPRGASIAKTVQSQPAGTEAGGVSPKINGAADSGTQRASVSDSSPASTPKAEKTKQSGGLTEVLEASRAELDRLLAETEKIHERSWRVIHT